MYVAALKGALTQALKQVFDEDYPKPDLRGLYASVEYPVRQEEWPGVWVEYDDADDVRIAGIAHVEYDEQNRPYTRWEYKGYAVFTVVALTSLERDDLYDELLHVMAVSHRGVDDVRRDDFRTYIEQNELVKINMDFDRIEPRGNSAAPGTPWGTDHLTYERSFAMQVIGEFVTDPRSTILVPLRKIVWRGTVDGYPEDAEHGLIEGTVDHNRDPSEIVDGFPRYGI